jgi:cytochrome o ubiquinol oxidase subunit II
VVRVARGQCCGSDGAQGASNDQRDPMGLTAGVLDAQGPVSAAERLILLNATGIMLVVVVPVILLTLVFAWWYRAGNRKALYRPEWSYSGQVELVVWAIPSMVVILLAGVGWIGSHELDPANKLSSPAQPLRIEVVSLDWKWLFIYPDQHVASVNDLVVPAATPLQFVLTSGTVMNAFFVPQLGSQIYTMPGMSTHLNLLADHPGSYQGLASHFSGDGFSDMNFVLHAVPAPEFRRWVASTRGAGAVLDAASYVVLAQSTVNREKLTYGSVAPDMFDRILSLSAPPIAARAGGP